jgi:hypothetical protein
MSLDDWIRVGTTISGIGGGAWCLYWYIEYAKGMLALQRAIQKEKDESNG